MGAAYHRRRAALPLLFVFSWGTLRRKPPDTAHRVRKEEGIEMDTYMAKPQDVEKRWFVVDASGKTLGRLASQIASILRGKNKPIYTPHVDTGDFVIVVNAEKVVLTGMKLQKKIYYRHSQYPGGLKKMNYAEFLAKQPEKVIWKAVWGMLPHNRLGRKIIKKLKVYAGPDHPHEAQQPVLLDLDA